MVFLKIKQQGKATPVQSLYWIQRACVGQWREGGYNLFTLAHPIAGCELASVTLTSVQGKVRKAKYIRQILSERVLFIYLFKFVYLFYFYLGCDHTRVSRPIAFIR